MYIPGVEGHGCIRSCNPNVLEEAFLLPPNEVQHRRPRPPHREEVTLERVVVVFFTCRGVILRSGSHVTTAALCRPQQRERGKDEQGEREAEKAKKMDEDRGSKGERQMEEDTSRKWCAFCSAGGVWGPLLSGSFTGFAEVTGSSSLMGSQRKGASWNCWCACLFYLFL